MRFLSNCLHGLSPPSADSTAVIPRLSRAENTEYTSSIVLSHLSLIINWSYKAGIVFTSRYNSGEIQSHERSLAQAALDHP